jgi:hypothetical protein
MLLSSKRQIEPKKVKKPLKMEAWLWLRPHPPPNLMGSLHVAPHPSLRFYGFLFFILCEKLIFKDLCLKENRVIFEEEGRGEIKIK